MTGLRLSVVIPAHDEEANIAAVFAALTAALDTAALADYELIFVNDGSRDQTSARMHAIRDPHVVVVELPARAGKSEALRRGLEAARFEIAAFIDADLQTEPRELVRVGARLADGYDYAVGWRRTRRDPWLRRASSRIANRVHAHVLGDPFHDLVGGCHVFRRECLTGVEWFEGLHRFLPYVAQRRGYRVVEVEVDHQPRARGRAKYGVANRVVKAFCDMWRVKRRWG